LPVSHPSLQVAGAGSARGAMYTGWGGGSAPQPALAPRYAQPTHSALAMARVIELEPTT
jgi:hypothetical protein